MESIKICHFNVSHLNRHLQSFWGASGDFWQAQWDKFISITGNINFLRLFEFKFKRNGCRNWVLSL